MAPLIKEKFVGNVERNYSGPIQGTSPAIAGGIGRISQKSGNISNVQNQN
jgi:hypothetical protein